MPDTLPALESERSRLLHEIGRRGDFPSGSITPWVRRCAKPNCHGARPKDPGHGPTFRLTYKVKGRTVTQPPSHPAARRKAEREIARFGKLQQLIQAFAEVNAQICRLPPAEKAAEPELAPEGKRRPPSTKRSPRK